MFFIMYFGDYWQQLFCVFGCQVETWDLFFIWSPSESQTVDLHSVLPILLLLIWKEKISFDHWAMHVSLFKLNIKLAKTWTSSVQQQREHHH